MNIIYSLKSYRYFSNDDKGEKPAYKYNCFCKIYSQKIIKKSRVHKCNIQSNALTFPTQLVQRAHSLCRTHNTMWHPKFLSDRWDRSGKKGKRSEEEEKGGEQRWRVLYVMTARDNLHQLSGSSRSTARTIDFTRGISIGYSFRYWFPFWVHWERRVVPFQCLLCAHEYLRQVTSQIPLIDRWSVEVMLRTILRKQLSQGKQ